MELELLGRAMLVAGVLVAIIGALLLIGGRFLPFLGQMPGNLSFRVGNVSVFVPLATCLLLSIGLTAALNILVRFLNRP